MDLAKNNFWIYFKIIFILYKLSLFYINFTNFLALLYILKYIKNIFFVIKYFF